MSRHRSVAFVTVTDLIRDKSLGCDEAGVWAGPGDPHQHPFVISTSFMTADTSEDVKDAPDLDTIDDCVYGLDPNEPPHSSRSPAPGVATSQIQQFPENSSLVRPRLLACQPPPPAKRSLPRSKIVTKVDITHFIYQLRVSASKSLNVTTTAVRYTHLHSLEITH